MEPSNDQASPFFSAWRPLTGWVLFYALLLQFAAIPTIGIVLALLHGTALPTLSVTEILAVITTTFGLGGMRTYEKIKGVDTKWLSRSTLSDNQSQQLTTTQTQTTVVEVLPSPSTTSTPTPVTAPSAATTANILSSLASVITPILSKITGRK